jgi:molybdopterin synthase sulfur carrier subunit/adenylyltransferase/sulfurtransferase
MAVVAFLGAIRRAAGRASVPVEADTVAGALAALDASVGPEFAALLVRAGALLLDVEVLLNGRNVAFLDGLQTPVRPADGLTVFYNGLRGFPGG